MGPNSFKPGYALEQWWSQLDQQRGDRADLRRCASLTEVQCNPAYQRIYQSLLAQGMPLPESEQTKRRKLDALAAAVALLTHLKADRAGSNSLPLALSVSLDDRPPVSPLRFRRLLESPDMAALFVGLRRVLPMAVALSPSELANDLWFWGDDKKKNWAYAYRWPKAKA